MTIFILLFPNSSSEVTLQNIRSMLYAASAVNWMWLNDHEHLLHTYMTENGEFEDNRTDMKPLGNTQNILLIRGDGTIWSLISMFVSRVLPCQ
jgi:hypothetical protein